MSTKYPGGIISKTAPTPSGPYSTDTAPGVWTLEQQAYWQKLGQWPTAGNVNPNAFIENLFSTYLYTGNGSTQTITNGIDLSTYGGLVWIKDRPYTPPHLLIDTIRGGNKYISSNTSGVQTTESIISAFNTTGFSLTADTSVGDWNWNGDTYVSWTFRKQAKFFDIVTWTGDGTAPRTINHNLGSTPGCILVKRYDGGFGEDWWVYHRSLTAGQNLVLNSTAASASGSIGSPTSTTFTISTAASGNSSGYLYVAYLFAHDAGGFGLTGTDNVISCGSFTTNGSGAATVSLGYEPQMLIVKRTDAAEDWFMVDNMRGWFASPSVDTATLKPNSSGAEFTWGAVFAPSATGFTYNYNPSSTYIYIAIRRGPMKVPTSGTSVFSPVAETPSGSANYVMNSSSGFPVDMLLYKERNNVATPYLTNRLTNNYLQTASTAAEASYTYGYDLMQGVRGQFNAASQVDYAFRRAPSFFDEVCYTGTGSATTFSHNLGAAPELMIVKVRDSATNWAVYSAAVGNNYYAILNLPDAPYTSSAAWNNTTPTSSVFTVGTNVITNGNGYLYVAYLFATCAGVSKVGSYTGTGTTLQVNCGFTGGARFVLIKRTDSTGDWYVWDSARGIVAGNDPYLLLNSTAAEVTGTDYVDTYNAGFEISSTAPSAINASGGTFIFLAIA